MTRVLPPSTTAPVAEQVPAEYAPLPPSLDEPSREVLGLALAAIDGMQGLEPDALAHEEEEVKSLLADIETDERRAGELRDWLQKAAGSGESRYSVLARLMGVPEAPALEEELSSGEIVHRFETQGYAKEAPKFADQLLDETRDTVAFEYDEQTFSDPIDQRGKTVYQTTELKGIRALNGFLGDFITKSIKQNGKAGFAIARSWAKSIRKNLTYIGQKELGEGSTGLGHYWSDYLAQDETRQLCVVTTSSLTGEQGRQQGIGLSDDFIRREVSEAMARMGVPASVMERIITDPRKISGDPSKVKIAFVDDWVVSGRQMSSKIKKALTLIPNEYQSAIEVDVLTAPPHLVSDGLDVDGLSVPVRAYYRAHRAESADSEGVGCHITGTHSTVNFGFSVQIERMQRLLNGIRGNGQRMVRMPAVASIYRHYWAPLRPSQS